MTDQTPAGHGPDQNDAGRGPDQNDAGRGPDQNDAGRGPDQLRAGRGPDHDTRPFSVAVFCGSRRGADPAYAAAAALLGERLGRAGMRLVYGGGQVGLMGVVADAALAAGGEVFGIIPSFLQRREVAHQGPVALVVTDTMHDRKRRMFEASDAFVVMPGGLGTFDEAIEITTWRQLGLHDKPILICDIQGWAQPYVAMIHAAIRQGFAPASSGELFEVVADVDALMDRLTVLPRAAAGQPEKV